MKFFFYFFLFCLSSHLSAQDYDVQIFDIRHGLHTPSVRKLMEDRHGFLWVGAREALYRFDGSRFQKFSQPNRMPITDPLKIVEDPDGQVLIHNSAGLFLYDGKKIRHITFAPGLIKGASTPGAFERDYFQTFSFDANGTFRGIMTDGIFQLSLASWQKAKSSGEITRFDKKDTSSFLLRALHAIEGEAGEMIFNVRNKLFVFKNVALTPIAEFESDISSAYIRSILPLDSDTLLVCVGATKHGHGGGLYKASKSGYVQRIFQAGKEDGLSAEVVLKHPHSGEILLLTQNGVRRFSPSLKPQSYHNLFKTLGVKVCQTMTIDQHGNVWVGSSEGLIRLSPKKKIHFTTLSDDQYIWKDGLYSVFRHPDGQLLTGTSNGTIFRQTGAKAFEKIFELPKQGEERVGEVSGMMTDRKGATWFLSFWSGLWRMEGKAVQRFWYQNGIPEGSEVWCMLEDSKHRFWIGLREGAGYFDNDKVSSATTSLKPVFKEWRDNRDGHTVRSIVEDRFGSIWLGMNGGLGYVLPDSIVTLIKHMEILDLQLQNRDELWVATSGQGVFCFKITGLNRLQTDPIYHYEKRNGLVDDVIASLEPDNEGNLWAAAYTGLSAIRKRGGGHAISNYDASDGLMDKTYSKVTLHYDDKGWMWGATSRGLFYFQPKEVSISEEVPVVDIRELELEDTILYPADFSTVKPLGLPWHKNSMTIHYSARTLVDQSKIRYRYRLVGGNMDGETFTTDKSARFHSLSPGTYRFEVENCNKDGVWSERPAVFDFVVNPPFYRERWFQALVAVLSIAVMYLIYHYKLSKERQEKEIQQEKAKNALLEKEQAEQQTRLAIAEKDAAKNREAKAIFEKQSIEYKDQALRLKLNPHFAFNSLNAIKNSVELGENTIAASYLKKFSDLMRDVIDNSHKTLIRLDEELRFVKAYVEFENYRNNIIRFEMQLPDDEEVLGTLVLNNMVQPFVENAIMHGLKPKPKEEGEKCLTVSFDEDEEHEYLFIIIEDNGIGRKAALKNKQQRPEEHLSLALPTIQERLAGIQARTGKKAGFEFFDLEDKNQNAIGTGVVITIPYNLEEKHFA
ncbi:MAG: histidine kinase [Saprospiraceae bacterium]|nr:histidine kinase [Saprospiraceae bacterium]